MSGNTDAIVIGSGPAGVSAARKLLERGRSVVLIDAGNRLVIPSGNTSLIDMRRDADRTWPTFLGQNLSALSAIAEGTPKLRVPHTADLREDYLRDQKIRSENFIAMGAHVIGGLSNFWGAVTSAYNGADLAGYPFDEDVLARYFEEVALRLGVSGAIDDDLSSYHGKVPLDGDLPVPASIAALLERFARRKGDFDGFILGRARNAVLSHDRSPHRRGCTLDNLCLWGCSAGAIYSSAFELDELSSYPHFTLESGFTVRKIRQLDGHWQAEGDRDGKPRAIGADKMVLAAGTLGTTRLVLDALGWHDRPVRLLSNPVFASAFLKLARVGANLPSQGFSMAQLQYRLEDAVADPNYAAGALYLADGLPAREFISRLPFSRPAARIVTRALMPAIVLATCYLSSDYSDNWLTLSADGALDIKGGHTAAAFDKSAATRRRLRRAIGKLGLLPLPGEAELATPGSDFHYAGTLPMGGSGQPATTASGEVVGLSRLYVVDGACLPRLAAKHPTMTIMANAARIADGIAL